MQSNLRFGSFCLPMTTQTGIYEIRNLDTDEFYVGSASNLKNRRRQHFTALRLGQHHNTHLQNSYNKHGAGKFEFKVLVFCDPNMLVWYEQAFIDGLRPTYNKRLTAESNLGIRRSAQARSNISKAHRGLKRNISEAYRQQLAEYMRQNGRRFHDMRKYTEEERAKMRSSMMGKNAGKSPSAKCRMAVAQSNKTRVVSNETRAKMSAAQRGRRQSDETRQKISETRKRLFAARKGVAEDAR